MNNSASPRRYPSENQIGKIHHMKIHWKTLFGLAALSSATLGGHIYLKAKEARKAAEVTVDLSMLDRTSGIQVSYKSVVDKAAPSVVYINTSQTVEGRQESLMPFGDDPIFRRFFGVPDGQLPNRPQHQEKRQGLGSGVIVSEDGYILTNTHVVKGADEIEVVLADGKKHYDASLVGTDPQTDVAVLKIDTTGLKPITLADSNTVEVGDVAFAIGNPLGVGQSVTMGIVSAKGRSGFWMTDYEDFIQTDASINPGNSGGALVDGKGRLIGINTFIVSRSGGNQGLGFAIPSNLARQVLDQLVADGKVSRGLLGVMIQSVDEDLAQAFGLKEAKGAVVSEVTKDSPAEKAGVLAGDIVVGFNGRDVEDHDDLRLKVAGTAPGTKAKLKVLRDGKEKEFEVTLGSLDGQVASTGGSAWGGETGLLEGLEVEDLTPELRGRYSIPSNVEGAVVTNVDPDSPSAEAGLKAGNVISSIDRKKVGSAEGARSLALKAKQDRLLLHVRTSQGSKYVILKKDS